MSGGLLIVNADDWGLRSEITDAIVACHDERRITSATAMVHMQDSYRAAEIAGERRIPLGLHLNLTYPFTAESVPDAVRERQRRLAGHFARRAARRVPDPRVRRLVADCIHDQREAFLSTFGATPTHVDGHEHIQVSPGVALSSGLTGIGRMRPAHTFERGERPTAKRLVRTAENMLLRHRFTTPDVFLDFADVHPRLHGSGGVRIGAARSVAVEVMCHPQRAEERAALLGDGWAALVAAHRTGGYAELG